MISVPQRLLGEALLNSAARNPSKTAVIFDNKEYTYSEFRESALKIATYLVSVGLKKGDRVAVFLNNSWENVISIFGISLAGGVFIVINPQTKADKLQYILRNSGARILISGNILSNTLSKALDSNGIIENLILSDGSDKINLHASVSIRSFEDILTDEITGTILPGVIPVDLAALIYTSGSTGFPKGVMMTHQSMVFTCWSLIEYLRLSEDERIILLLPLAFDYGLYQLLMTVTIGGTLILEHSFSFPATIYKRIELYQPTVFPGVPTMYAMMINTHKQTGLSFNCIEKVTNTASALHQEFLPFLKAIFPRALIFKMYGLTECKRVCYLEPELLDKKPGSVGKAIPGTEVFILDQEGNPVSTGETGILHIRGPHIMAGYWNNEEQSREMLKQGKIPGEKVLCSHDLFKADEEGFLYFLGRTDDIIKTRGEKVSPVEIENVIYKIKGVREAAVIGVTDQIKGESIIAFVTLAAKENITESHIMKTCSENLELFMVPERIIILDEMPKSPNGKIDKLNLKKRFS